MGGQDKYMGNFKKGSDRRFGGRGGDGFGRRDGSRGGFGGERDRGPVTMHQATCGQCGKPCEVPFRPTGERPVYCNTCFQGRKENKGGDRFPQKNYSSYKAPVKPDFRSDADKRDNDEVRKQLEILNGKMDRLIKAIESMANTKPLAVEEKIKKKMKKTAPAVKIKKIS